MYVHVHDLCSTDDSHTGAALDGLPMEPLGGPSVKAVLFFVNLDIFRNNLCCQLISFVPQNQTAYKSAYMYLQVCA